MAAIQSCVCDRRRSVRRKRRPPTENASEATAWSAEISRSSGLASARATSGGICRGTTRRSPPKSASRSSRREARQKVTVRVAQEDAVRFVRVPFVDPHPGNLIDRPCQDSDSNDARDGAT